MFNPQSRWDRHLPNQENFEGERIEVGAVFKEGKMIPRWFIHRGRKFPIQQITYEWRDKKGLEERRHFAVTDGTNVFQITFSHRYLHWRVQRIVAQ